ncbi:MAG: Rab family GTPase [Candidatus Kariarchaeaceae archaeon]
MQRILYKCCLLGDYRVGKTSIRRNYMGETFVEDHITTIGAGFAVKRIPLDEDKLLELQVWDLAGQSGMDVLLQRYIMGSHAAFIVFDLSLRETFDNIDNWLEQLFLNLEDIIPIIILGNKNDLETFTVTETEIQEYAKTGDNIENAFNELIQHLATPWK